MKRNEKLKTLLVSPSPLPVGGIQSWTVNLLDFLEHQDQTEFNYINSSVKYKDILEMGLWKRISAGIKVTIDLIRAIKLSIHINKPNVIHLTSSASLALFKDLLILRVAKKNKTPLVIHWRFGRIPDLALRKNWEWYLITHIIRKSAYSIVIDDNSYKILIDAGFKNVINIANPISEELAKAAVTQKNIDRNVVEGKVIFVGHIIANKGIYELVETCVTLPKVKQLKLIGPVKDKVKAELKNIAMKRGDGNWLLLTGTKPREIVFSEISSAELLVLPSYTEGFPNVILEAMAMACPVVATNVGAIPEMLNINSNSPAGLCIPTKDIEALKTSIEKLLSDKELGTKYGQNGLTRVLENFTLDKIFKKYEVVWQTAADNHKFL